MLTQYQGFREASGTLRQSEGVEALVDEAGQSTGRTS